MAAGSSSTGESVDRELVITRVFDAPRDLVWKAFTEPDRLTHWWGPKGFTTHVLKLELRPGGVFFYSQKTPDGREMFGKWVYREIVALEAARHRFFIHRRQGKSCPASTKRELAARDAGQIDIHREPGTHVAHNSNQADKRERVRAQDFL